MAQTWHQVRPGEIRNDCGGCHAHSQKPTLFEQTAAAKPDYKIFDRSCAACHTQGEPGASATGGNLVLDDDKIVDLPDNNDVPGTYYRLAMDYAARFGHKPIIGSWRNHNASRYIRMFQSRRSLLVWKIHGERLDGWSNDDFPTETKPGDARTLQLKGQPVANTAENRNRADLDLTGSIMPPPKAVKAGIVAPLSDEDRLTIARWIDLGCPIDLDYDPAKPQAASYGWMLDDQRPTLALSSPLPGKNPPLKRILVGMYDYAGLHPASFKVTADFAVSGIPAGQDLAPKFRATAPGVWELALDSAVEVEKGILTVSVKDRQGNIAKIERTFTAGK
jgi:hypothetical protein